MSDSLERLFLAHAAQSFEKQHALADLLGDHSWNLSLSAGTISLGEGQVFPIQVLGTESEHTGTWLWAWANDQSQIPTKLLKSARRVRKVGQEQGVLELAEAEWPLDGISGHYMAMVCSGLCGADAYYRCPYEGGAAFVLVSVPALRQSIPHLALRMSTTFTTLISTFEVADQKAAFLAYTAGKGLKAEIAGSVYRCQLPDGDLLLATFDRRNRLVKLETELNKGKAKA